MIWWDTEHWHAYERAYNDLPGTRSRILQAATWPTRIVDLRQDPAALWASVRRSYKSLIHKAQRTYTFRIGGMVDIWTICHPIHVDVAGRETRAFETWRLMADWIGSEHGLVVVAETPSEHQPIGFVYFIVNNGWSYYASAASVQPNVNHALIWTAMLALKANGVQQLELGWHGHETSDKERSISQFKRGFGGVDVPAGYLYGGSVLQAAVGASPAASTNP